MSYIPSSVVLFEHPNTHNYGPNADCLLHVSKSQSKFMSRAVIKEWAKLEFKIDGDARSLLAH